MFKLINVVLLLNVLVTSHSNGLSADIEDRRNETVLHKYATIQWDNFKAEWKTYIIEGKKG